MTSQNLSHLLFKPTTARIPRPSKPINLPSRIAGNTWLIVITSPEGAILLIVFLSGAARESKVAGYELSCLLAETARDAALSARSAADPARQPNG
jgi:hypothetical protein